MKYNCLWFFFLIRKIHQHWIKKELHRVSLQMWEGKYMIEGDRIIIIIIHHHNQCSKLSTFYSSSLYSLYSSLSILKFNLHLVLVNWWLIICMCMCIWNLFPVWYTFNVIFYHLFLSCMLCSPPVNSRYQIHRVVSLSTLAMSSVLFHLAVFLLLLLQLPADPYSQVLLISHLCQHWKLTFFSNCVSRMWNRSPSSS